jgi:Papain-like cysteine protease AvrRpt2
MVDAASIDYLVPDMTLISQDQSNACWFASAMMVLTWKANRNGTQVTVNMDQETLDLYQANDGISNDQIVPFAIRVGLLAMPPQSPTIDYLLSLLQERGPLWVNGVSHIVVIAGLRNGSDSYEVLVYDPDPDLGVSWKSLSGWFAGLDAGEADKSTADTSDAVEAVFLYAP